MKRFLVVMLLVLGLIAGLAIIFFFGIGYYLSPQSELTKADTIVAISGGETDARTAEAVKLYKDGWGANIIFSGAALDPASPSNARTMEGLAGSRAAPEKMILAPQPSLYNLTASAVRASVSPPEMATMVSALVSSLWGDR